MVRWLVIALVAVGIVGCRVENETVDIIEGRYFGCLNDGEWGDRVVDSGWNTHLTLDFYEMDCPECSNGAELWLDIEFHGWFTVDFTWGEADLGGPEEDTVEGVTVIEQDFICSPCKAFGYKRKIFGEFSHPMDFLEIRSDGIGVFPLYLVGDSDEDLGCRR